MSNSNVLTRTLEVTRGTLFVHVALVGAVCLGLYGYFLFGAISNGGEIGRMQTEIREQSSRLGELEAEYMALKKTLSIEEAYELGFVSATQPTYLASEQNTTVAVNR
ncbi:MAG: hypothetical protein COV34_02310 [Candidatus Zambryskibacteria bacterium CG10_big_fil_rev_8_21_14_0_10_42_12]|uniref:Cell division protein FtsL n=1 Tax=Candidatus Zambryskibacteria bacterium CG10_big_fil_rev_8_21_14_0_10_42_12 TaxID=1975115 RepID=A0A2H0QUD8_9BACT|nr:MAG: hypothetical protein COV34_02310 [Candidatus Zambryskibacteria bacterium CG10_big_fil_rev_8_21_14_0_10_42_12]